MKRLISPIIDGGVPYLNQDFFNILQNNNFASYKCIYDEINDIKRNGNNGIIIKGVVNTSTTNGTGNVDTYQFNFRDSMVYLDGDFQEPAPYLVEEENYPIGQAKFWIIRRTKPIRRYNKVKDEEFDMLYNSYFDISFSFPTNSNNYIEIEVDPFNANLTTRYLSRILKWNNCDYGEVLMTLAQPTDLGTNVANFSATGLGLGSMFGFRLLNPDSVLTNPTLPTGAQGVRPILPKDWATDLSGRFLVGFVRKQRDYYVQSTFDPQNLTSTDVTTTFNLENYGELRNSGSTNADFKLTEQHLPPHSHGSYSGIPNNDLSHSHEIEVASPITPGQEWLDDPYGAYLFKYGAKVDTVDKYNKKYQIVPTDVTGTLYKAVETDKIDPELTTDTGGRPYSPTKKNLKDVSTKIIKNDIYGGASNRKLKWDHSNAGRTQYGEFDKYFNNNKLVEDATRLIDGRGSNHNFTDHTHEVENAGGDVPHVNLPPYYVIAYYQKYDPYK